MRLQNLIKRLRFCAAAFVEDVKVGDGEAFKDEKDLRSFMRWILRGAPGHKPTTAKALTLSTLTLRIYEPARNGGLFLVEGEL